MRLGLLVFIAIFAANIHSQDTASSPDKSKSAKPQPSTQIQIRALLEDSKALPPEFASDVILQLVEHGLVRDDPLKAKLLNDAFEKASLAQDDYPERPWGVDVEETPGGLHAIASMVTGLNRISLQTRVVRQVLSTNPSRARQMFESIQPPRISPQTCNAGWFYQSDAYYNTLNEVLSQSFSPREIDGGFRAGYVASIIENTKSHVELVSAVQLLNSGMFTDREFRELVSGYASFLRNFDGDPQSFAIAMSDDRLFDGVSKLISLSDKNGIDSRIVLEALRGYLVGNLDGLVCSEVAASKGSGLPDAIVRFNEKFGARLIKTNLGTIDASELKNEDGPHIEDSSPPRWNSKTYSDLLRKLQGLSPSSDPDDTPKTAAGLRTFLAQAQDLLTQLSAWSEGSEPETEFFHQKAILMEGLAQRTIGTSLHREVLDRFMAFLQEYPPNQIGVVDWYLYAKKLLSTNVNAKYGKADLTALLNSGEPVLTVYARLGLLLQTSAPTPVK